MARLGTKIISAAVTGALLLGTSACGEDDDPPPPVPTATDPGAGTDGSGSDTDEPQPTTSPDPEAGGVLLHVVEAGERAVGDGEVIEVDFEDDGDRGWQVVVRRGDAGVEVTLDENDLSELSRRDKKLDADDLARTAVDVRAAIGAAAARTDGQPESVQLDEEDGRAVWELSVRMPDNTMADLTIDADSGEVVKQEAD